MLRTSRTTLVTTNFYVDFKSPNIASPNWFFLVKVLIASSVHSDLKLNCPEKIFQSHFAALGLNLSF